jgi:pilus assembly protein Flp/PilA
MKILNKRKTQMPSSSKKEKGATMVEYAIMVALIAIVSIAVITTLGRNVSQTFQSAATAVPG